MGVSVVIPTYNRAHLLPATLESVLRQRPAPREVIVVDDGSTDDTAGVLANYATSVRAFRVANGGDLRARNIGTRAATGELVGYCDSDDLWQPGFLAAMLDLWAEVPNLLSSYGNFRLFRDGHVEERTKFDHAPPGFWDGLRPVGTQAGVFDHPVIDRLLTFQPFFPSAMAVRREPFMAIGGWDESVSRIVGCDLATALRVAEHPLGVVRPALVGIRRHSGNISADVQAMNLGDAQILELLLQARPALAAHRELVLASIASRRVAAAATAFDRRDFKAVRSITGMLAPRDLSARQRVKSLVSRLPRSIAGFAADLMSRGGG